MPLYSKSIQEIDRSEDGFRICIMRKPPMDSSWDIWMPVLAPPLPLFESYKKGEIDWAGYVEWFRRDVIVARNDHIRFLADMAKNNVITILCWEKEPERCHRRLIAEEVMRVDPQINVVIK